MVRSSPEFFRTYTYDALGQLLTETRHDDGIKVTNTYNHLGNIRTRLVENSATGADLYLYTYNYSKDTDAGWNYLLTSIVTQDYINNVTTTETVDYDAIGNPTTYRGATLAFNGRQLTSYTKGSNAISYKYDASGLRSSKTVNGNTTIYQYVGDKLYFEQRADGSKLYFFYDSYGNLSKIYYHVGATKTAYNVLTNSQGDVIAIYNWNGNQLVASYSYDAWGNCTITQDTTGIGAINPIRYRGYYFDSEIGMYYLQSRYYDPNTGRFINADGYITTGQGVLSYNMYAYCMNNPVMMVDYDGDLPTLGELWEGFCDGVEAGAEWLGNTTTEIISVASSWVCESEVSEEYMPSIFRPLCSLEIGTRQSVSDTRVNNQNKSFISLDFRGRSDNVFLSSVSLSINTKKGSINVNLGADNTGCSVSVCDGDSYSSLSYRIDVTQLKVGFESSTTAITGEYVETTNYTNFSYTPTGLVLLVCAAYGMPSATPVPVTP